jgi:hypothetical protein
MTPSFSFDSPRIALLLLATLHLACSAVDPGPIRSDGTGVAEPAPTTDDTGDSPAAPASSSDAAAPSTPTAPSAPSKAPTWTNVYAQYFAATSPGKCGASGCHSSSRGRFKCGTTKDTCYAGLVASRLIDTKNPTASSIANDNTSPLSWFGGNMPGRPTKNQKAHDDISAWVSAGALNN